MNPSSSGWINKHIPVFQKEIVSKNYSEEQFYEALRKSGFIYANSISTLSYPNGTTYNLNLEEISKVNLFDSLGFVYFKIHPDADIKSFLKNANAYYRYLKKHSLFSIRIPFLKRSSKEKLEKIIDCRVQRNASVFHKNFSSLISNALLYLDVLVFEHYLKDKGNPIDYATSLEALLANTVYLAFKQKSDESQYEKLVLKLIETSIRYNDIKSISLTFEDLDYAHHKLPMECRYILDLAIMTVYSDETLEEKELYFIQKLAKTFGFNSQETKDNIAYFKKFIAENKAKITYLDYSNPFKNLYDNTNDMVRRLILRNRKRLIKELKGSEKLLRLIAKSTSSNLNEDEKKIVKTQLLDICKIVPSMGIFLLPGGSILLPILVKLIPDLLPSAFEDNR